MERTNSLPGIRQLRKGIYLVRVTRKDPRTGKKKDHEKTVTGTLEEAAAARVALVAALESDQPSASARVHLADYARSWLSSRLHMLKASTRDRYARELDTMIDDLGDYYLDALRAEDIQRWMGQQAKTKAPSTVNSVLRVMRVMFADAAASHGIPNPVARIRALPERSRRCLEGDEGGNVLTAQEMSRFLEALRERWPQWYALVFTQFATARRFGEVSALRWEDIDEGRGVIRIRRAHWRGIVGTPKTDRVVSVPLTGELKQVLRDWRTELVRKQHRHLDSGWVFPSRSGTVHHNSSCMKAAFVDCLEFIEVAHRFTPHGLRHTANDLLRRVASGEIVRAITGHVTPAMTEHYSRGREAGSRRGHAAAPQGRGRMSRPTGCTHSLARIVGARVGARRESGSCMKKPGPAPTRTRAISTACGAGDEI